MQRKSSMNFLIRILHDRYSLLGHCSFQAVTHCGEEVRLTVKPLSLATAAAAFLLCVLSYQAGRAEEPTPNVDSVQMVLDGVAKMSPAEQQAWLAQLEQRAARAARQTMSPEDAAKQQAKTQKLLHQKMVTWQVLRDVLADTDAREKTIKASEIAKELAAKKAAEQMALEKERAAKIAEEKAAQKAAEAAKQQAVEAVKTHMANAVEALKANAAKAMEVAKTQPAQNAKPQTASSPLKKGTGSEPASENAVKNNDREVPVPFFQQTARVTVNAEELDARIGGCNLAFRELESTLNEKGEWNAAKLEPLLDRLKELVIRHDDLGLIRAAASKEQRASITRLETTKPAISQFSALVVEARNRASDPKFGGDDIERQAELVRLDAISHRLAELGGK
jgi:hypothetical protein